MKYLPHKSHVVILFGALTLFVTATARSTTKPDDVLFKGTTLDVIERNLAMGLNTRSPGVQASASQVIRDLKTLMPEQDFSLLVIPLMRIVKNEDAETQVRMIATLALHELNSLRGDFAITQLARFTSNTRVQHLCGWLAHGKTP